MSTRIMRHLARGGVALAALIVVAPLVASSGTAGATGSLSVRTFAGVGYGYLAPGPNGSMWSANYNTSKVTLISASGVQSTYSVTRAWGLTSDPQGNAYPDTYTTGPINELTPGGTLTTFHSGWSGLYGMAWGPDGNLYVGYEGGEVYKILPNGSDTLFASGVGGLGLAFDHVGNLYAAGGSTIYKISPTGSVTTFATVAGAYFYSLAVSPFSNQVFAVDDDHGTVDSFSGAGVATTVISYSQLPGSYAELGSLAFDSAGNLWVNDWESENVYEVAGIAGGGAPTGLTITPGTQSLTATWSSQGSGTYLCTLMYGFNEPSTFSQVVSGDSCTFAGLDPNTVYGISVAESAGGTAIGQSAIAFGQPIPPAITITCVRKHKTRHITGVNPVCPTGWHRTH